MATAHVWLPCHCLPTACQHMPIMFGKYEYDVPIWPLPENCFKDCLVPTTPFGLPYHCLPTSHQWQQPANNPPTAWQCLTTDCTEGWNWSSIFRLEILCPVLLHSPHILNVLLSSYYKLLGSITGCVSLQLDHNQAARAHTHCYSIRLNL